MDDKGLDGRLQQLLSRRGQDLVRGLLDEISILYREIAVLRHELTAVEEYRAMRDRWMALEGGTKAAQLPKFVAIEAHHPLRSADGFYPPERTADGIVYRWTGPSAHFTFNVFIDRSRGADVVLETISCVDPVLQRSVSLFVNGESLALEVVPSGDGFAALAMLPACAESCATNLTFTLPAALSPGTEDSRQLGTAFHRLLIGSRSEAGMHPELAASAKALQPARAA